MRGSSRFSARNWAIRSRRDPPLFRFLRQVAAKPAPQVSGTSESEGECLSRSAHHGPWVPGSAHFVGSLRPTARYPSLQRNGLAGEESGKQGRGLIPFGWLGETPLWRGSTGVCANPPLRSGGRGSAKDPSPEHLRSPVSPYLATAYEQPCTYPALPVWT